MLPRINYRSFAKRLAPAFLALLVPVTATRAAEDNPVPDSTNQFEIASPDSATHIPSNDTLLYIPPDGGSAAKQLTSPVDLEQHLSQNPTAALFKSMLVPGLGQIGNRSYFKAGLFAGLEIWFASKAIDHGREAADAYDRYQAQIDPIQRAGAYGIFDSKRKERNKYIWYTAITVFVSMFDAYVDAHLSGSPKNDRNDKFGFDLGPDASGGVAAQLTYAF